MASVHTKFLLAAGILLAAVLCVTGVSSSTADSVLQHDRSLTDILSAVTGNSTDLQILEQAECFVSGTTDCLAAQDGIAEGRGKKKKFFVYALGAAIIAKAAILPIVLGFLKLLTGKALLITKMALLLITVISLKRSGHNNRPQVINLLPKKHHEVYPEVHSEYTIKG